MGVSFIMIGICLLALLFTLTGFVLAFTAPKLRTAGIVLAGFGLMIILTAVCFFVFAVSQMN